MKLTTKQSPMRVTIIKTDDKTPAKDIKEKKRYQQMNSDKQKPCNSNCPKLPKTIKQHEVSKETITIESNNP